MSDAKQFKNRRECRGKSCLFNRHASNNAYHEDGDGGGGGCGGSC